MTQWEESGEGLLMEVYTVLWKWVGGVYNVVDVGSKVKGVSVRASVMESKTTASEL